MDYHVERVDQDTRHSQLNDLIWSAVKRAQTSATKKPICLSRSDGKRPDSLIPSKRVKPLAWNITIADTYSIGETVESAEAAAKKVATNS